jgi:hypothetical protein
VQICVLESLAAQKVDFLIPPFFDALGTRSLKQCVCSLRYVSLSLSAYNSSRFPKQISVEYDTWGWGAGYQK